MANITVAKIKELLHDKTSEGKVPLSVEIEQRLTPL